MDRLRADVAVLGRRGRAVAIVGEHGTGKSQLAAELLDGLGPGDVGLAGRACEFERNVPFAPIVAALDPYLSSLSKARLRGLDDEQRPRLAAIFPALASPDDGAAPSGERHRSHEAVRALLEQVAAGRRCVLVLDDAHWLDDASVEQIAHLLRHPPTARVLLVLVLRQGEASPRMRAALDTAIRDGACETVELGTLPHPPADGDALAAELTALTPTARALLDGASVAGDPCPAALAAAIAGLEDARARHAADELMERDLVRPAATPGWLEFRHPSVRRAVYRSTGDAWRLGAHARAAEALGAAGAPAVRIAHHVARSADMGDDAAIDLLARAGRETRALAPAAAAHWYAAALRLLPPGSGPGRRSRLLVPMATALTASGQIEPARDALGAVRELIPVDQALLRTRPIAALAMLDRILGRGDAARATLRTALDALPDRRSDAAAILEIELAGDRYFASDWVGLATRARSAAEIARATGDPVLVAAAVALLGLAELDTGEMARARACAGEAGALVDGLDDEELALHLGAAHWVGWCEHHLERYPDVVRHYERGLDLARRGGHGLLVVPLLLGLTISRMWLGDVRAAVEDAEAGIDSAYLVGNAELVAVASGLRCWTAVRAGGLDRALRRAEPVMHAPQGVGGPQAVLARAWFGEALAAAGAPGRGCELILAAAGGPELPALEPFQRPYLHGVLASAAIAAGDLEAAALAAHLAQEAADDLGLHGPRAWALRARGELALARGDARAAANLLLDSAAAAGAVHPLERERSRALAGRALGAAGRRPAAAAALEQAHARLAAWSATRLADLTARELRRMGVRGRRPKRSRGVGPLSALSPRELEVAQLIEQRLTNREIAEQLVLSPRTVEHHVEHILDKLGVESRGEVARAIERERGG
jgi:DNA-binding CsgD family transcriptional regulator